jgi:hypothetical protein
MVLEDVHFANVSAVPLPLTPEIVHPVFVPVPDVFE